MLSSIMESSLRASMISSTQELLPKISSRISENLLKNDLDISFYNQFSSTNSRSQQKNRFTRIKPSDEKVETKEFYQGSTARKVLSWMINSKILVFTSIGVMKAARSWMAMGVPSTVARNGLDKKVDELSGSAHLSKVFHLISPIFALQIQDALLSLNLHDGLNRFLEKEFLILQTFVDVLLPTVFVNLAQNIKDHSTSFREEKAVTLVDIISLLVEITEAHLPSIQANYGRISTISDEKRKYQKLYKLFSPITDDFLAIALPNEVKDMVFAKIPYLSNYFWKSLKKVLLPSLCVTIYQQIALPLQEKCQDELALRIGGEYLINIAKTAGTNGAASAALMLANSEANLSQENADKNLTTNQIIKAFTSSIDGSEELKIWVGNWLAKQLSTFGKSSDPHINSIWKILGSYVEVLLIHVFENLLKNENITSSHEQSKDVLGCIFYRLSSITSKFLDQNRITIERRIAFLVDVKNVEEDPELLGLFNLYASEILKAMGLFDFDEIPLPEFAQDSFVKSVRDIASKFLLRQYFALLN